MDNKTPDIDTDPYIDSGFHDELRALLNRYSLENQSDTPDFILANYLISCLEVFAVATRERESWHKPPEKA